MSLPTGDTYRPTTDRPLPDVPMRARLLCALHVLLGRPLVYRVGVAGELDLRGTTGPLRIVGARIGNAELPLRFRGGTLTAEQCATRRDPYGAHLDALDGQHGDATPFGAWGPIRRGR